MLLSTLELRDFRNYAECALELSEGTTVIIGANGQGKTNLLEAIGYLATLSSFRGAQDASMVNSGADTAIIRARGDRDGRALLLEAEIHRTGRNRTLVNRQPLRRSRDLLGALRVSVFAPDDLELIKGAPGGRRLYLDDLAVALEPAADTRRVTFDRVLRQRNALLKQSRGRLDHDAAITLDVWDTKLAESGEALAALRRDSVERLAGLLTDAYRAISGGGRAAAIRYEPTWSDGGLINSLRDAREDEVRRGVTTVGPHRDEIELSLGGSPARTHASQGEQRTFALALRLAAHSLVGAATGSPPVLLLDDVFSELDEERRTALLQNLPEGQTLVTSAADVPVGTRPDVVFTVSNGQVS